MMDSRMIHSAMYTSLRANFVLTSGSFMAQRYDILTDCMLKNHKKY